MKYIYALAGIFLCMLMLKLPETVGLHFTDGNNFIFLAKLVSQGKVLYRDIYLDNFPLMIYLSVIYRWITFGSMQFFNMTSTVEKIASAILIYAIIKKKWQQDSTAFIGSLVYFLSYTTLSSSFQMGFQTSVLCILAAYFFSTRKQLVWAGVFAAASVLIKAYSVFPVFGLFIYIVATYHWKTWRFVGAGLVAGILVMLPTLLLAFPQFWAQTFGFGLVRGAAESKLDMYLSFAQNDFLVFLLCLWNLTLWRKNLFIAAGTALMFFFFLVYKDIYYIYFSYFPLFAALGVGYVLEEPIPYTKIIVPRAIVITLFVFAILIGFTTYFTTDRFADLIPNEKALYRAIQKEQPDALYGYSYVINGITYETGIPPYKNMYDITTTGFNNAGINRTTFTKEITKTRTLVLVDSVSYDHTVLYDDSIMDTKLLKTKPCRRVYTHFVRNLNNVNRELSLVRCY